MWLLCCSRGDGQLPWPNSVDVWSAGAVAALFLSLRVWCLWLDPGVSCLAVVAGPLEVTATLFMWTPGLEGSSWICPVAAEFILLKSLQ